VPEVTATDRPNQPGEPEPTDAPKPPATATPESEPPTVPPPPDATDTPEAGG
jgi:hypothetical protein